VYVFYNRHEWLPYQIAMEFLEEYMTHFHGKNITPNFIFIVFSYKKNKKKKTKQCLITFTSPLFLNHEISYGLGWGSALSFSLFTISRETMLAQLSLSMTREHILPWHLHLYVVTKPIITAILVWSGKWCLYHKKLPTSGPISSLSTSFASS
jgi:hypothetical protein